MAFQEVTYRPLPARALAAVTIAVCVAGAVALAWWDPLSVLRSGGVLLLVAVVAWSALWRPSLRIEEHGITVTNVLRTFFVPWPAIERVDTRFSLTLYTAAARVPVWVSPAPGRHRAFGLARSDFEGVADSAHAEHGSLRPSDALSTTSGGLAHVIRRHWEDLRDAGMFAPGREPGATTVTWHVATIAALLAAAAATAAGLLL